MIGSNLASLTDRQQVVLVNNTVPHQRNAV